MADEGIQHVPVLVQEVKELLSVTAGDVVVDCTVGEGGHARMLTGPAGGRGLLIGMDVDEANLHTASQRLEGCGCPFRLFRCNFRSLEEVLAEARIEQVDVMLADLGVSSGQLSDAQRGLSFQSAGPLDMRLDDRLSQTASDLVNALSERELANLLYDYGQERFSRRIARRICRARRGGRLSTTAELAGIVAQALGQSSGSRASKIHPATRTFQALRIAVNDELNALRELLAAVPRLLRAGGRVGVISFHSLEDGIVKTDFRRRVGDGIYTIVTKKPVTAGAEERQENPRSRSAKLRVARRTEKQIEE